MRLVLPRDTLVLLASRAATVATPRSTTPVLSCVLLEARGGVVRATATDKATTVIASYAATVLDPGECCVRAADLATVAKAMPAGPVELILDKRLEVKAGRSTFKLDVFPASDFPAPTAETTLEPVTFTADGIRRIIDVVLPDVAPEDNRYGLNGAFIEPVQTSARLVGTDGNRLSYAETAATGTIPPSARKRLLPRTGMMVLRKAIDGYAGEVVLAFADRAVVATAGDLTIHMRLLEADFPDYRQVIPTSFKRFVKVDRATLQAALTRVLPFAADGARTVRMAFAPDGIILSSRKLDAGDARDEIAAELEGEPITMGFNTRFLLDAIGGMRSDVVKVSIGDQLSPTVWQDPADGAAFWVVMPLRLDS